MNATMTKEFWAVNGRNALGWRIDRIADDNVGLDMLRNPVAIVPDKKYADRIATLPEVVDSLEAIVQQFHAFAVEDGDPAAEVRDKYWGEKIRRAEEAIKKARGEA